MRELALVFLKLGTIAVGGPAAHIAMMRHEFVDRRAWLTEQEFLDLIGATNLIPGPNSTEMAIHIGHRRAGWPGLLVAGTCFIVPAALIVFVLAVVYVRFGALPQTRALFYGVNPAVLAIVGVALLQLARSAVRVPWHGVVAAIAVAGLIAGVHELVVLAVCGVLGATIVTWPGRPTAAALLWIGTPRAPVSGTWPGAFVTAGSAVAAVTGVTLGRLFLVFVKAGALLFGSGYVLAAFLRADFVHRLGWLTERQLLDAITVGQVTPGPVFTTATFIGYVLAGPAGAAVATVAIFLPAFVYVAISGPLVPRMRRSRLAGGVLDGVNVASLALMAVVWFQLGRSAIVDIPTGLLACAGVLALVVWRVSPAWLLAVGAALGALSMR
ncbi:MAG: chromate efflux transporter [Acidobacteriota bacterium]